MIVALCPQYGGRLGLQIGSATGGYRYVGKCFSHRRSIIVAAVPVPKAAGPTVLPRSTDPLKLLDIIASAMISPRPLLVISRAGGSCCRLPRVASRVGLRLEMAEGRPGRQSFIPGYKPHTWESPYHVSCTYS